MIPGRVNRPVLEPTRTGVFRGACAEYCGTSHALMHFSVVVQEREDFTCWLAQQAQTAVTPTNPHALRRQAARPLRLSSSGLRYTLVAEPTSRTNIQEPCP